MGLLGTQNSGPKYLSDIEQYKDIEQYQRYWTILKYNYMNTMINKLEKEMLKAKLRITVLL